MLISLTLTAVLAVVLQNDGGLRDGPAVQPSSVCSLCHSNAPRASAMRDGEGRAIAPFDLWRGTMMANSARDPVWRAAVSAEVAATPSRRTEIEETCLRCHAPMARQAGLEDHGTGSLLHVLDCDSPLGELARDGVSCTVCHGITQEGLGTDASFSGNYLLDSQRRLFGPHEAPFSMPMRHHTEFTPSLGRHLQSSSLCATCHTLETDTFDAEGNAHGTRFLEQAPYLEWLNSDFSNAGDDPGPLAATCQDCHTPTADEDGRVIRTRIARNPGGRDFPPTRPREPFGRHIFVGGNTLVPQMLRDHADELEVQASSAALQATLDATREQLRELTARVSIVDVLRQDSRLTFAVHVENLTGHKLPTGHPTRRAWLRVVVRDERAGVIFASGNTDSSGRILGEDGAPRPSEFAGGPIEPHRQLINEPGQVATYQATMADSRGRPTHTLLRGATWFVDDRLLPLGWSSDHPAAQRTTPVAVDGDADFVAGSDRVRYEIAAASDGQLTIEAALLYQSLSARWAAELMRWDTPEVETFATFYLEADRMPEILATAEWRE